MCDMNNEEIFYQVMWCQGVIWCSFFKYCSLVVMLLGLGVGMVLKIVWVLENKFCILVVWIYGLECICCIEFFICFVYLLVKDVIFFLIFFDYDDILMVVVGIQVEEVFEDIIM